MKQVYLIVAAIAFALLMVHWSPWTMFIEDAKPLTVSLFDSWGHYLGLERELWTSILAGLTIACLGQGLCGSCCRRKEDAFAP